MNFTIEVTLNDKDHTLDGVERIEYFNNSPDTLRYIWFHLFPNAYKNDQTAFSDQLLENGNTDFYFSEKEQKGYINRLDFKVGNITATLEDHPQHIDISRLILPTPLPPGEKIDIITSFHVQLPSIFSRSGHDGQSYQVTQWYPKPAVYDHKGWHPMPYLDQGEFYSEFGNYDVHITVPQDYVVAATGVLQDKEELAWMKNRSAQREATSVPGSKTLRFIQENVHDFAFFADKRFLLAHDTMALSSGRVIDLYSFYTAEEADQRKNVLSFMRDAVSTRSEWIGEYPYDVVSVVQGPEEMGGGMEYPTITIVSAGSGERMLEYVVAHEVSHNWFYGILASNERRHPWMDEGLNTYYDNRHAEWKHGTAGEISIGKKTVSLEHISRLVFETKASTRRDQPIITPADSLTNMNYGLIAYYKAGAWFELLEKELGREQFDRAMQQYFRQWRFRHPYPEDLRKVFEESSGRNLERVFSLLDKKGSLEPKKSGWTLATPLSPGSIIDYINKPSRELLLLSPSTGVNSYDKFMAGLVFTNYKLPPSRFQFLAIPLYAFGSKRIKGLGRMQYSFYPQAFPWKIDLFVAGSMFSSGEFTKDDGDKVLTGFRKIAPGLRLSFHEKNPRSWTNRYVQFKTFFINEESYRIRYDTIFNFPDTVIQQVVSVLGEDRTMAQLKIVMENYRTLYPYAAELNIEHGKDFMRIGLTGNYFFNYPKEGGLNLRLFAGKFFYLGEKTFSKQFATDRYHLNMTGPNGQEDYTYSDYFAGRNRFEGLGSQQIMVRDGAFKVRTDLYAQKVGKTDDWLAAVNLSSSIPSAMNPLSMLPVEIPIRLFADIGTYAEAWKRDSDLDRFVFDAGLQFSFFRNLVNIYVPVVYSRIYKDYVQSVIEKRGRLKKIISFSIDLSRFNQRELVRAIEF